MDDSEPLQPFQRAADLGTAVAAMRELEETYPAGMKMAQFALRWILGFDAVTCVIAGAN